MNQSSPYDNLRWCDRHKYTQIYHHIQAFAKKIRKRKKFSDQEEQLKINANAQQRQIDNFYKQGWQYEHAHPSLSCDISDPFYVQPKYKTEQDSQLSQSLSKYYQHCKHLIQRLRTQHEDETAFRVESLYAKNFNHIPQKQWQGQIHTQQSKRSYQNIQCAQIAYKSFLQTTQQVLQSMLQSSKRYSQVPQQHFPYIKIIQVLQKLKQWIELLKDTKKLQQYDQQYYEQGGKQPVKHLKNIYEFIGNFVEIAEKMREQKRSCLFNYQPQVSILTYIIHPMLLGLYAFYYKQKIVWKNEYQHTITNIKFDVQVNSPPLLQDPAHFQITRTCFINLDGYQSQFNIEYAKNMENHMMYVSFPKFDKPNDDQNMVFNNRFFKKILFNYSRQMYEYNKEEFDVIQNIQMIKLSKQGDSNGYGMMDEDEYIKQEEQGIDIRQQLQVKYDPQRYYQSIKKMYKNKHQPQKNKNIFIIPVSFKYLQNQLANLFPQKCVGASKYASQFIYYLIKDFLIDDIRKFNPNMIVVSYSNNLYVKDEHFVKIMQQLSAISRRRVCLFPNFSTKLIQPEQQYLQYDNFIKYKNCVQDIATTLNLDMMKKYCQFLKISSGTYNLQISNQKQSIIPRFKQSKLNNYIRGVLSALSFQQYQHLRNRISDLILRSETIIINRSLQQNKAQIKNNTPHYYQTMCKHIKQLITNQKCKCPSEVQDTVQAIRSDIDSLTSSNKQYKDMYISDIQQKIQLQIAAQKYSQIVYIYMKTKPEMKQYEQIKQSLKTQNQNDQNYIYNRKYNNNLSGVYALTLKNKDNKQKTSLLVTPRSQIVYKTDQKYRVRQNTGNSKKYANVMLMNNLQNNIHVSYAGLVHLAGKDQQSAKIQQQKVDMYAIAFENMPNLNTNGQQNYIIRSNWSYAETAKYYILYWPQKYNILQAKLKQINQQPYQPVTLNQIYVCQIPDGKQHRLTFKFTMFNDDMEVIPRRHACALELFNQNKIFILGGFYDREYNYLSLQKDITGLDLSDYSQENRKCLLSCQKGQMYQILPSKLTRNQMNQDPQNQWRTNSYIRARRQYQFYQLSQLKQLDCQQKQKQAQQIRTFYMIGGFGQNFVRPFSLLSCNYYVIDIDLQNKRIKSVHRKMVYDSMLTSNIKGFIKNNGYFCKMPLYKNNSLLPDQYIGTQQYVAHRSVYSLVKQQSYEQLKAKTKYMFAIDVYNKYKKQYKNIATKIGQYIDIRTNDTSQFLLSMSPQGNHYLIIRKNKSQEQTAQIMLQKMQSKNQYLNVPLTHGSIVSIDIKFKSVYAIVRHQLYTKGKYVLTHCQIPSEQAQIKLQIIQQMNFSLEQHYLFVPRPGELLLLHGLTFENVGIEDIIYKVPKKQSKKDDHIKKIPFPTAVSAQIFKKCYTVIFKDQNKDTKALQIQCVNFLLPVQTKPKSYALKKFKLSLSTQVSQFIWQTLSEYPIICIDQQTRAPLYIARIQQVRQIQSNQLQQLYSYSSNSNTNAFGTFNSPAIIAMSQRNHNPIIMKALCYNKGMYIGMISNNLMARSQEPVKVVLVASENKDAKKVWQIATQIKGHMKSIPVYQDMDIPTDLNSMQEKHNKGTM